MNHLAALILDSLFASLSSAQELSEYGLTLLGRGSPRRTDPSFQQTASKSADLPNWIGSLKAAATVRDHGSLGSA